MYTLNAPARGCTRFNSAQRSRARQPVVVASAGASDNGPSPSTAVFHSVPEASTSAAAAQSSEPLSASRRPQQLFHVAAAAAPPQQQQPSVAAAAAGPLGPLTVPLLAAAGTGIAALTVKQLLFSKGSRAYQGNVGEEYDAWTEEGILEYYWGEHIHLGHYSAEERKKGAFKKDFKQAKYDFIDEMLRFSGSSQPSSILDVGSGFGGTSRHLAKMFPQAQVQGITLSPKQVERGTQLAKERGLNNVNFQVMDALAMTWPDNSFDLVWACESGEHMPDKKKYVEEMVRVLKPGGTLVIACWCQREETPGTPFTEDERDKLQFLYDEWAHPYFISIQEFERLMKGTGKMEAVVSEDWTPQTIDSWRHSVWVGMVDPWIVVGKPHLWYKTVREIVTLERMHQAFACGLMEYGLIAGRKMPAPSGTAAAASQMVGAGSR